MKKNISLFKTGSIILSVFLVLLFTACKKEKFTAGTTSEFSLKSNIYGANYDIKVGLPDNYSTAGQKYATIYILDGKDIFGTVGNQCKQISESYGKQNVLVVSISYGRDRSIDYTPTKVSSITGGAPEFMSFIETQLIPAIQERFHADTSRSSRTILGHSYGGLFGAYAFTNHNHVFGNYIMLSPSLWFDNMIMLQYEKNNRAVNKGNQQLVFMGIGENEEKDRMLAPFETFTKTLYENYPGMKLMYNVEPRENHMGSRSPNIVKGLIYYFKNRY
jgi:predicted alpha/beta superfamily hydrolase